MKKRVLASLVSSLLIVCLLGTSAFATTTGVVKFNESFEIEPVDNFYVSMPEIRSYGDNLLWNTDESAYADGTMEDNKTGTFKDNVTRSTEAARSGSRSLKVTPTSSKQTLTTKLSVPKTDIVAGAIYELEVYVKCAKPYSVSLYVDDTSTNGKKMWEMWAAGGQKMDKIECSSDWQRLVSRFSIGTSLADVSQFTATYLPIVITVDSTNVDSTEYVAVYFDDATFRRVTNAEPSTVNAAQAGLPTYPIDKLSGKNAQVGMYVKNKTGEAKDLTLITAYYNADGSLNSVLDVYKKEDIADSDTIQYIQSDAFPVPAGITTGKIKVFAWDGATNLFPYTDVVDSTDVNYLAGVPDRTTPIPTTDNWFTANNLPNASNNSTGTFGNVIESGNAKTGVRALYVPTVKNNTADTVVGATFKVDAGRKYQVKYYVSNISNYTGGIGLTGATKDGQLLTKVYSPEVSIKSNRVISGMTKDNSTTPYTYTWGANNASWKTYRFYGLGGVSNTKHWDEIIIEFETPAAGALANDYKTDANADYGDATYWDTFGDHMALLFYESGEYAKLAPSKDTVTTNVGHIGRGMWVDDITVTDIGPAGE